MENEDVKVSYTQFKRLVRKKNKEIEKANLAVPEEERQRLLDEEYLLRRYCEIMANIRRTEFIDQYGCRQCLFFEKVRECFMTEKCLLEEYKLQKRQKKHQSFCPADAEGDCPYGNEVGTCFGFCMRDILAEMRERKRQHEKDKEQEESGGCCSNRYGPWLVPDEDL